VTGLLAAFLDGFAGSFGFSLGLVLPPALLALLLKRLKL
jgi:hypothetical protein